MLIETPQTKSSKPQRGGTDRVGKAGMAVALDRTDSLSAEQRTRPLGIEPTISKK